MKRFALAAVSMVKENVVAPAVMSEIGVMALMEWTGWTNSADEAWWQCQLNSDSVVKAGTLSVDNLICAGINSKCAQVANEKCALALTYCVRAKLEHYLKQRSVQLSRAVMYEVGEMFAGGSLGTPEGCGWTVCLSKGSSVGDMKDAMFADQEKRANVVLRHEDRSVVQWCCTELLCGGYMTKCMNRSEFRKSAACLVENISPLNLDIRWGDAVAGLASVSGAVGDGYTESEENDEHSTCACVLGECWNSVYEPMYF